MMLYFSIFGVSLSNSPIFISFPESINQNSNLYTSSWSNATVISDDSSGWNNMGSYYPSIITGKNGTLHVVWTDNTFGPWGTDYEIFYANYTDAGWSNATCISDIYGWNDAYSAYQSIAIDDNGNLHVVWTDDTDGEWGTDLEIMYTNRTAAGWSNATVISDDATGWNDADSNYPSIATDINGNVHVVWQDDTNGTWGIDTEIMYTNYTATGWSNATAISDIYGWNNDVSREPCITTDKNGIVHVVWHDDTDGTWGTDMEIMYSNYTASGWSNATAISDIYGWNDGYSSYPSIATDNNGSIHVVWQDIVAGEWGSDVEIFYTNHTTAGWSNATVISDDSSDWNDGSSWRPSIATDNNNGIHVVWEDYTDGEWGTDSEIMYVRYTSVGWSNATCISDLYGWNDLSSVYASIATDNYRRVHIVWQDDTDGEWGTDQEVMYSYIGYPTSNHPLNITTSTKGSETINWTLWDAVGSGKFRVWTNDTNDIYYIWQDWIDWTNNTNLLVPINRTTIGFFNYTIEYNNSMGEMGIIDTVMVNVTKYVPSNQEQNLGLVLILATQPTDSGLIFVLIGIGAAAVIIVIVIVIKRKK